MSLKLRKHRRYVPAPHPPGKLEVAFVPELGIRVVRASCGAPTGITVIGNTVVITGKEEKLDGNRS